MLLIHDLNNEDSSKITPFLPPNSKIFSREIDNIKGCLGCFNCWIKTPGKCVIKDSYTEIPKYIIEGNTLVIITEIKYGCYSSYVKNVIDRSIGILLPFFQTVNGELHHLPRYDNKSLKLVVMGYGKNVTLDEEETFKNLIKGNAINMCMPNYETHVIKDISEAEKILQNL